MTSGVLWRKTRHHGTRAPYTTASVPTASSSSSLYPVLPCLSRPRHITLHRAAPATERGQGGGAKGLLFFLARVLSGSCCPFLSPHLVDVGALLGSPVPLLAQEVLELV